MNQSMHFYLSNLVGDAQQLIITTDNAKIPLDLSCSDQNTVSTWGSDDCSMHSRFSSYSGSYSQTSSSSMTDSSQGCRWGDSEGNMSNNTNTNNASRPNHHNNNGGRKPKKPQRRPASPTSPTSSTRSRSTSSNSHNHKSLDEEDHVDHRRRRTTVDCSAGQKITLANAVATRKGPMLRMPQRRASNDGTRNKLIMESQQAQHQQRRSSRNSHQHHNKRSTTTRTTMITNTATKTARYSILGDAIRELTLEEELAARGALTFTATRSKTPQ